ncbi:MAG: HEPN domain-containing protein [Thermodesulfobacteriota bacterium]|nr:HEPN domain-containing protein [Thermodesulfobacteriota bacterium]
MSLDKEQYEATRWIDTAIEDLEASRALLEKKKFSHACFFAQQCGEKALKALWFNLGHDPWGHSIQKLIAELPDPAVLNQMENLLEEAAVLDRYYIPTRYPNGLPDLTPGKYYFEKDATLCITSAQNLVEQVKRCMGQNH